MEPAYSQLSLKMTRSAPGEPKRECISVIWTFGKLGRSRLTTGVDTTLLDRVLLVRTADGEVETLVCDRESARVTTSTSPLG